MILTLSLEIGGDREGREAIYGRDGIKDRRKKKLKKSR